MGILNLAPVKRGGMKLLISLYGMSETGKTLSALKLAAGIEPDPAKRALLDTEGGQRGRAYVDQIQGGYIYGNLTPPFTPDRYRQAIDEIEAAGINVLVIDSVSHAWFAEGGVLDMVDASAVKNDLGKWIKPKKELRRMTNRMLSSDMHIILCARGKIPMVEAADPATGKKTYMPGPVVPIQEKSLRFDMTVIGQMLGDGKYTVTAPAGKCPGSLRHVFAAGDIMNEAMGRKLAEWVAGADVKSPEQRKLEIDATTAAEGGIESFRAFWRSVDKSAHISLKIALGNYESIAKAADDEAERQRADASASAEAATINERPFGSGAWGHDVRPSNDHNPQTGEIIEQEQSDAPKSMGERISEATARYRNCATEEEFVALTRSIPEEVKQQFSSDEGDEIATILATIIAGVKKK